MKNKFYLFSFLILFGLMSCQQEESFAPEEELYLEDGQNPLTRGSGNPYAKLKNGDKSFYVYDRNAGTSVPSPTETSFAENYTNKFPNANLSFKGDYYTWQDAQTACPPNWRLPTNAELNVIVSEMKFDKEKAYLEISGSGRCYFPLAGHRTASKNIRGHYWSSSASQNGRIRALNVGTNTCIIANNLPALGFSVRCVKEASDDQDFKTVVINGKTWMAENLNRGEFVSTIGEANYWQFDEPGIQKWGYDNNEANCDTYGGLYEYWEMMTGGYTNKITPSNAEFFSLSGEISTWEETYNIKTIEVSEGVWHVQGICPDGWHLPSDEEWDDLPTVPDGFNAQLGGYRGRNGYGFYNLSTDGYWWSSTPNGVPSRYRYLTSTVVGTTISAGTSYRSNGFSVRCVRN